MEAIFTFIILLITELALTVILCAVAGICALCGLSFSSVFTTGLWLLLLPPLLFLYGAAAERNIYRVKEVEIRTENLPETFDGYRIAHISDIHLRSFSGRLRSLKRAVAKINALAPDAIAMTGDLVTFNPDEIPGCDAVLSELHAADGVYAVLGNHDYCLYDRSSTDAEKAENVKKVEAAETAMGWKVLGNRHENITRQSDTINIIGVENISASPHFFSAGNLAEAMKGAEGKFKILLSHDPTHWRLEVTGKTDIDLTLSGHTHAMQLSFFGWTPSSLLFQECSGLYVYNELSNNERNNIVNIGNKNVISKNTTGSGGGNGKNQYLYVNTGLGETGFPVRIGARPEITLITLKRRND